MSIGYLFTIWNIFFVRESYDMNGGWSLYQCVSGCVYDVECVCNKFPFQNDLFSLS